MTKRLFPIWLAVCLSILAMGLGYAWGSDLTEQWRLAARYTARVGFPIFLLTYAASSIERLWPGDATRRILRHRRQWGLAFTLTHSVHLVALAMAYYVVGEWPSASTLAGGGLAYVLLYLMAFSSNNASQRAMGVWWKRLHTMGIHWLWFIFTFSYFGRVLSPDQRMEGIFFFGLCLAALGLRIAAYRKKRTTSSDRSRGTTLYES